MEEVGNKLNEIIVILSEILKELQKEGPEEKSPAVKGFGV